MPALSRNLYASVAKKKSSAKKNKPVIRGAKSAPKGQSIHFRLREVIMLIVAAIAVFLLIALFSYHSHDPGWSTDSNGPVQNLAGRAGAWCSDFLLSLFGFFSFLVPFLLLGGVGVVYYERHDHDEMHLPLLIMRILGAVLTFVAGSALASVMLARFAEHLPQGAGGILGNVIALQLLPQLNLVGTLLVLWVAFLVGLTLFAGVSWLKAIALLFVGGKSLASASAQGAGSLTDSMKNSFGVWQAQRAEAKAQRNELLDDAPDYQDHSADAAQLAIDEANAEPAVDNTPPWQETFEPESVTPEPKPEMAAVPSKLKEVKPEKVLLPDTDALQATGAVSTQPFSGQVPSIDVLDKPKPNKNKISKDALEQTAAMVEQKLADFGVKAEVVGVCPGPIVTRYELHMAPGTKVSKLTGLAKDLARSLATHSVRIVEVIPGKPYVGLELPNEHRDIVRLKEVLAHDSFSGQHNPLLMGLGKDIAGEPQVVNLGKMPHLLVAGTTGSGKSVGVNAMLLSMLLKATPDELRLIMIDPKMLELSIYEGIPHLLTPVVTDMKEAANSLRWCVKEMDRRYQVMAAAGVRNIAGMNDKIRQAQAAGKPMKDPLWIKTHPGMEDQAPDMEPMPYIVVVVDEFADMIMVVGKKVEELIARLAQKARAAGVHLILATQRPSVDVITGLIKANIPTRIAFQVSSKIDSRTILDQQGAEQLLGHGDMLYLPPGTGIPMRVHGAFVADHEVHAVVAAWQKQGEPNYIDEITAETPEPGEAGGSGEHDPLYDEAVAIVMETQRASISGIQRRLKIGYNRAARLIEEMEDAGIVSEMQSNGMREILVNRN